MAGSEPKVMVTASQHQWQAELFRHAHDVGGLVLLQDGLEHADVVIYDDESSQLDRHAVQTAQHSNVVVVVLATTPNGRERAERLKPDYVWDAALTPEELTAQIRDALAQRIDTLEEPQGRDAVGDVSTGDTPTVIAVLGDSTAVEIAVGAGVWLRRHEMSVALVDADTAHPVLAQRLDIPPIPNVVAASEKVRGGGSTPLIPTAAGLAVGGLANTKAWAEWPPEDAALVIGDLAVRHDVVIALVDSRLDDLSTRSRMGRFDVARRVISGASDAWIVMEAAPDSHTRVLEIIADIRVIAGDLPVRIWATRTPKPYAAGEWRDELERIVNVPVVTLPESRRVLAAAWNGELVGRGGWRRRVHAGLEAWWDDG